MPVSFSPPRRRANRVVTVGVSTASDAVATGDKGDLHRTRWDDDDDGDRAKPRAAVAPVNVNADTTVMSLGMINPFLCEMTLTGLGLV